MTMTEADRELLEMMAAELQAKAPMQMVLTAPSALQIAGLIQLATRHPRVSAELVFTAECFLEQMREYFADCPMVLDVIRRGDDPDEDR